MKVLIVFLLLVMSSLSYGQVTYFKYLQNTYDSTTAANYDTLYVLDLSKQYEFLNITFENVGSVPCTLAVKGGSFIRNASSWSVDEWQYPVTDTVYYSVWLKDATGSTPTSIIIANGTAATYIIMKPRLELVQTYITQNAGGKVNVFIEPTKPK